MRPQSALALVCLGILLAGCTDETEMSAPNADASIPLGDADLQVPACGAASSFGPSQIFGLTPYGNLNLEFERTWFANGCGAMSMSMSYLPVEDVGYRFVVKFAVPALEFSEGRTYGQPGVFPVALETSVCNLDGQNCIFHDTEGSVDVEILADDEGLNPNTNLVLNFSSDASWELSAIEAVGQSCAWTWNPC